MIFNDRPDVQPAVGASSKDGRLTFPFLSDIIESERPSVFCAAESDGRRVCMEKTIGEKIYELRKARGLTQEQVGEKLNVTGQAVSKWEKGVSHN